MNHELQPGNNNDKPYLPRSIGGHGTLQVHQIFEDGKRALEEYLKDSDLDALKVAHHEGLLNNIETKE